MALVKEESIRRHPIVWGLVWATATLAIVVLIQYGLGQSLPNLRIAVPIGIIAGLLWGYSMKWWLDRKAAKR